MTDFKIQKRRLIAVWLYNMKQVRLLRKYGNLIYISWKMRYCLIYINEEDFLETQKQINKLHFVRKTEKSYRPDIEMNFADKIGTKALDHLGEENSKKTELFTDT